MPVVHFRHHFRFDQIALIICHPHKTVLSVRKSQISPTSDLSLFTASSKPATFQKDLFTDGETSDILSATSRSTCPKDGASLLSTIQCRRHDRNFLKTGI